MNKSLNRKQQFYDSRPKFMMQFNKQQPVPRLISINESIANNNNKYQSINNTITHNQNTMMSQNNFSTIINNTNQNNSTYNTPQSLINTQPHYNQIIQRKQQIPKQRNYRLQVLDLQSKLQQQIQQKCQLQQIIKQLTVKSERLKQINQHLINRLKEVEKNYIQNRSQLQKQYDVQLKKQKEIIYSDIQNYIKFSVSNLNNALKCEKMTIKIQAKLQEFMEELLQINPHTVQLLNQSRKKINQSTLQNASILIQTSNLMNKQADVSLNRNSILLNSEDKRSSSKGPQISDYNTILNHLEKQRSRINTSQNFYNSNIQNTNVRSSYKERSNRKNSLTEQKSMFRHQYSTTPHKRKKIFKND